MALRRRRPSRYSPPSRRAGSLFVTGTGPGGRGLARGRRRGRRRPPLPWPGILAGVLILALAAAALLFVRGRQAANDRQRAAARSFVAAWADQDLGAMWALTGGAGRPSRAAFERSYAQARRAATVRAVQPGRPGALDGGEVRVPVTVRTRDFGALRGTVALRTADVDGRGVIRWSPAMRLPGLGDDEAVRRTTGKPPRRGEVLAADGSPLAATPTGAGIAGTPDGPDGPTGLERIYDVRLAGRPASTLRFGDRVVERVGKRPGRDVHSTISPGLTSAAEAALGGRLGGVAVIRPRDGAVRALAGLAVSAPQAPGSVFKVVTLAAALEAGVTSPSDSFPVRQYAVLSGVRLANAGDESCGGSLANSLAHSCNSVFAPMGAEVGRKRLVAMAEEFGFNRKPRNVPAVKPSTIPEDLRDDLAVGSAAIGQERDLATPLQMASVTATIANGGVRVAPRLAREEPRRRKRVIRRRTAETIGSMMVGVVTNGTGTAAAIPGVTVAGKTGTAELVSGRSAAASSSNAWFIAFAPHEDPEVAVAVMLVGGGFGGESAAPVARQVMQAGL